VVCRWESVEVLLIVLGAEVDGLAVEPVVCTYASRRRLPRISADTSSVHRRGHLQSALVKPSFREVKHGTDLNHIPQLILA